MKSQDSKSAEQRSQKDCAWRECSRPVDADSPYKTQHGGTVYYFCCDNCKRRFEQENPPD